jgi:nitroalkane oxidase
MEDTRVPIDFTLTTEQVELQATAGQIAQRVLAGADAATRHLATPQERFAATRPMYEQLVEAGLLRRLVPAPLGGTGTGVLDFALLAEELIAVDASVSLTLFATALGFTPVLLAGTPEQQERFLAPFLSGSGAPLAAFGFSEPQGSANFADPSPGAGLQTRADRDGDEWIITGAKRWVSNAAGWNGEGADLTCIVARTDLDAPPAESLVVIAVPRPGSGFAVEQEIDTVGHRAHLVPQVRYENVRVPVENALGEPGSGLGLTEMTFGGTAAVVGAFSVGLMRAAFDEALRFARAEHRAGPVPIIDHQAVGDLLSDVKTKIEAVRSLTWRAAHALDTGSPAALELSVQTKVFGSETAVQCIYDLMRAVGIQSYAHDLPFGRILQDALAYPLFDGGNMGVRRRQLHAMLRDPSYDPLATVRGGSVTR